MRRFILIDQSITGEGGHYLTYARAVIDSAVDEGFCPVLCVNQRFNATGNLPYCIYPIFRYTSLESTSSFRLRNSGTDKYTNTKGYLWGGIVKPIIQRIARSVLGEHYYGVRAKFSLPDSMRSGDVREQAYKSTCFLQDLLVLFSKLELDMSDVVFFPTISFVELHGLEQALRTLDWTRFPPVHLLFRWNPFRGRQENYEKELQQMIFEKNCFRGCEDIGILHFYTDSERLAEQYNCFSRCRFSVLPIPHTDCAAGNSWQKKERWILSYLGDARPEKGFLLLPKIVEALPDEEVQFQIQANFNIPGGEGGIAACRRKLSRKKNVVLYKSVLDAKEYASALRKTDIVLILYDPKQYYARSSGIFAEAMAAGIPTLVPADTWMSVQLCRGRYTQIGAIAGQFKSKQIDMGTSAGNLVWKRESSHTEQIILQFTVDWDFSSSIRIEAVLESEDKTEIKRVVDFVEKVGDNECFLSAAVPETCNTIRFFFSGTYGQDLPQIRMVKMVDLPETVPMLGGIGRIFDNCGQCGAILKDMIECYADIRKSAELYSLRWTMYHNPKSLIDHLMPKDGKIINHTI